MVLIGASRIPRYSFTLLVTCMYDISDLVHLRGQGGGDIERS